MSGISQIGFSVNDIVPIILPNPLNSTVYTCTIDSDVNGYTWNVTNSTGAAVSTGSELYGAVTGQFAA